MANRTIQTAYRTLKRFQPSTQQQYYILSSLVFLLLYNISIGDAFLNPFVQRQTSSSYGKVVTTSISHSRTIPFVPSITKLNHQQHHMIHPKLFIDLLIQHTTMTPTTTPSSSSSSKARDNPTLNKILPIALLTKLYTTPFAAFGVTTGTTIVTAAAQTFFNAAQHETSLSSDVISVETQVLNDMSHLGIDLAVFFIPSLLLLRIAAIIGRICTITADYIPDHVIVPEELVFQSVMLTLACLGLIKSALIPMAASIYNTTSSKDGRAYTSIFLPAGTSWLQYKALCVCGALEWVTMQNGDTVTTTTSTSTNTASSTSSSNHDHDEYIYWLYAGNVSVEDEIGDLQYVVTSGKKGSTALHRGLFGEQRLLQRFGKHIKPPPQQRNKQPNDVVPSKSISHRVIVTSDTVTLLRINTQRLQMVMDLDPSLAESMRTMVFQGMEAKLHAQVQETSNLLKSFNVTTTTVVV
jgi:hypothetical protein